MPLFAALDRRKADLDALRPLAPEQEQRVLQKFRLEWNYNSNAIEGNSLTLGETKALLFHDVVASGKRMRDHDDIRNHNKVVAEVESLVTDERPITEHMIREMHEVLMGREPYYIPAQTAEGVPTRQRIEPGNYKKIPNHAITATGETLSFASPEETPARMTDLVKWYRQEEATPTMPPVALAAEFHYRFVRIHPFDDGNGRMSRLLMNLILLRHGYPMTVIKATDRNRYLAALSAADAADPEPFLRFIIENVEASLQLMIRAAKGESIDEPDDLDKKLALLKKRMASPTPNHSSEWDSHQRDFVDAVLEPWLFDLVSQTNRFDSFFTKKKFSIQAFRFYQGKQQRQLSSEHEAIGNATEFLRREFQTPLLFSSVQLVIKWEAFQRASHFNINLSIEFVFNAREFVVINKINETPNDYSLLNQAYGIPLFQANYGTSSNDYDIARINYQLANKVYDFIAAKVAEADTPPA